MKKKIKVSVIIPIYNAELYLEQCINSILEQTLQEIEVICVDDGSTDASGSILEKFEKQDKRLSVIALPHSHGGAGFPRNKGLEAAQGDYLSFLDADDYFDIHMLEEMYGLAKKNDADVVWCDANSYDTKSGRVVPMPAFLKTENIPRKEVFSKEDLGDYLFCIKNGEAWNGLYKHEFISRHRLRFQEIHIADDMLFSYSVLLYAKRMCVTVQRYVYYRINNSESQNGSHEKYPTVYCDAFEAIYELLLDNGWVEQYKKGLYNVAAEHLMKILGMLKSYTAYEKLYSRLKDEFFDKLGLVSCKADIFDHIDRYLWVQDIHQLSLEEFIWKRQSRFCYPEMTLIPQTEFPQSVIPQNAKILLYGGGAIGKAWFTQVLYSKWCSIAAWVDRDAALMGYPLKGLSEIADIEYDYVLIAVLGERVASEIRKDLIDHGVEEHKIVWALPR